jgi:hypothetical protein
MVTLVGDEGSCLDSLSLMRVSSLASLRYLPSSENPETVKEIDCFRYLDLKVGSSLWPLKRFL